MHAISVVIDTRNVTYKWLTKNFLINSFNYIGVFFNLFSADSRLDDLHVHSDKFKNCSQRCEEP